MRIKINTVAGYLLLAMTVCLSAPALSQQVGTPPILTEEEQKAKQDREKKAVELLEQVISEAQSMKLPENRIRIQINAGDLLWERDESRARTLFLSATAAIVDLMRNIDISERQYFNQMRVPSQLRQELVLAVARHESTLAYQVMATTRPPAPPGPPAAPAAPGSAGVGQQLDADANLERNLLAQIAATDPKVALQNAEDLLAKGEYSSAMASVLKQLQKNDKEAATKFQEKLLRKLTSENLLATAGASGLAMALLRPGPRIDVSPQSQNTPGTAVTNSGTLDLAGYREVMEAVIAAALKATPAPRGNQGNGRGANAQGAAQGSGQGNPQGNGRRQDNPRVTQPGGGGGQSRAAGAQNQTSTLTTAQIEQNAARGLVGSLQPLLPQIDQYLPARGQALRQKMSELGINPDQRRGMGQFGQLLQQGSVESILTAAATASPQVQPRLYQQAAMRALEEGNTDLARKIANEHLESALKTSVLQNIDLQAMARAGTAEKVDEVRQSVSRLRTDDERIRVLLQLAAGAGKQNEKLALSLLEEARNIVSRRPANYQQFDAQLRVARAFSAIDPAKVIEVLEPGITQLNDLLPAAAILSGFEVNVFKDGELPLQGGSMLTSTLARYALQIASIAKDNFDLAVSGADKFQLAESRLIARMAIIRVALGRDSAENSEFGAPFGAPRPFQQNFPQPARRQP